MPASFASMFAAAASAAFRNNQAEEDNYRAGPMSPPGRHNRRRSASPPPSGPIGYPAKMYPGPSRPVLPGAGSQMSPAPQNQPNMAMMAQFSNAMMNNPAFMTQMSQMFAKMTQQGMNNPAAMSASIQNMQAMMANFAADYFGNQGNDGYGNSRPMPVGGQFQGGFDRAGDDALLPNPTIPGSQTANMFSKAFQTYLTNFAQNMSPAQPMPPSQQFGNNMGGRGYPPPQQQQQQQQPPPHMNQEFNNFGNNNQPFYNSEYGGEHQYPGGANQNYNKYLIKNGASVSICKSGSAPSIRTFYNNEYNSTVLVATNPSFGLSNMIVKVVGSNLTCTFDRINIISRPNYIQLGSASDNVYIIAAYGPGSFFLNILCSIYKLFYFILLQVSLNLMLQEIKAYHHQPSKQ